MAGSGRRGEVDNETGFLALVYSFIRLSCLQNCRIYYFWSAHPLPAANTAVHAVNQVKEMIQGSGSIPKWNVWVSVPPKDTDLLSQVTTWPYKHVYWHKMGGSLASVKRPRKEPECSLLAKNGSYSLKLQMKEHSLPWVGLLTPEDCSRTSHMSKQFRA